MIHKEGIFPLEKKNKRRTITSLSPPELETTWKGPRRRTCINRPTDRLCLPLRLNPFLIDIN